MNRRWAGLRGGLGRWLPAIWLAALLSLAVVTGAEAHSWQARDEARQCRRVYVVKQGDTLSAIARRYRVSVRSLVQVNRIRNANRIYVGQRLCIPGKKQAKAKSVAVSSANPWTPPVAAIEVFSPQARGVYHSPIEIIGFSRTFEGTVHIRLKDVASGEVLAERIATGGGQDYDFFHTYIRFEPLVEEESLAVLELFEVDANSGAEINKVNIPIILVPGQRMLDVFTPTAGQKWGATDAVTGYSWTFEGNVVLELSARDGTPLQQTAAIGGGIMYDGFSAGFDYAPSAPTAAVIGVYAVSPRDGRHVDETRIPITLTP